MSENKEMDVDMQESGSSGCKKATEGLESSSSNGIMAALGTAGSVSVSLHPLVIMNISEHWTRTKAQMGNPQKIFGALIGKQKGREGVSRLGADVCFTCSKSLNILYVYSNLETGLPT